MSFGIAAVPPPGDPRKQDHVAAGPPSPPPGFVCPNCGAKRITTAAVPCWLCQKRLRVYTDPVPAAEPLDSLAFILLAVLVLLVVLGLMLEAPGLGIVLAIVSTLALVRAMSTARKSEEAGMPMSGRHKIGAFFGSLGVVVLTGVGAFIAFFASFCFVAMQGISNPKWRDEKTQFISVAAGVVAGIYVLIRLLKKYWPKQGGSGKKP